MDSQEKKLFEMLNAGFAETCKRYQLNAELAQAKMAAYRQVCLDLLSDDPIIRQQGRNQATHLLGSTTGWEEVYRSAECFAEAWWRYRQSEDSPSEDTMHDALYTWRRALKALEENQL